MYFIFSELFSFSNDNTNMNSYVISEGKHDASRRKQLSVVSSEKRAVNCPSVTIRGVKNTRGLYKEWVERLKIPSADKSLDSFLQM